MSSDLTPLGELGDLLSGYVTHGSIRPEDDFQELFATLDRETPAAYRQTPVTVYRVLAVTSDQLKALEGGETVRLTPRDFGSWTDDQAAARRFMRLKGLRDGSNTPLVMIRKVAPEDGCVVDVKALYSGLGWDHPDVDEWDRYVLQEAEIILRQDESLLTFSSEDVILWFASNDPMLLAPTSGDRVWIPVEERMDEVEAVLRHELRNDEIVWTVACADGDERTLTWDHRQDCWDGHALEMAPAP